MEMIGYLGKKVDITCKDGQQLSGHVFDVLDAEDSDIGRDCIDLAPIDKMHIIEIAVEDIKDIKVDNHFKTFDFHA